MNGYFLRSYCVSLFRQRDVTGMRETKSKELVCWWTSGWRKDRQ